MASILAPTSVSNNLSSSTPLIPPKTSTIFDSKLKFGEIGRINLRLCTRTTLRLKMQGSRKPVGLTEEFASDQGQGIVEAENESCSFDELKDRFLSFKKHKYMDNLEYFQSLAKGQAPKFMVIACADSRVCPSHILGFQPGEAFMVRNVANLVPPYEGGPMETNAALEFAVNSLEVENILVIGHSCCGGIRALMSMEDEVNSSFIGSWVFVGKDARLSTKSSASNLSFDQQCRHCEKESVNCSLLNLLTYPWIEERVKKGVLSIHGGYYNFVDCTFEKWTLDYEASQVYEEHRRIAVKDRSYWC
ncbi:beta carbonic anhydrase 5, chloroplastic isoform X2 [Carica papaya]|uniref:beta carbonic anhydrase 5, chloroplastic isoform X2 n=1 Tax=Carica papaya TaxID=3649 RepID=UPI000B8D08A4|nr:beta carbonic anhydrase 5, chloroplastic isoform X2 [Carica papaya]